MNPGKNYCRYAACHVNEAHSSLEHGNMENFQNPEPNGDNSIANGDSGIVEPSNDLETPRISTSLVISSCKYEISDL